MKKSVVSILSVCILYSSALYYEAEARVSISKKASIGKPKSPKNLTPQELANIAASSLNSQIFIIQKSFNKNLARATAFTKGKSVSSQDLKNFLNTLRNEWVFKVIDNLQMLSKSASQIVEYKNRQLDAILSLQNKASGDQEVVKTLFSRDLKAYNKLITIQYFESAKIMNKATKNRDVSLDLSDDEPEEHLEFSKENSVQRSFKNKVYSYIKQDVTTMSKCAKEIESFARKLKRKLPEIEKVKLLTKIYENMNKIARIAVSYTIKFENVKDYKNDLDVTEEELNALEQEVKNEAREEAQNAAKMRLARKLTMLERR